MIKEHQLVSSVTLDHFYNSVRDISDFPTPGILFRDITPLLLDPDLFRQAVEFMAEPLRSRRVDKILAIESRGFILGAPIAMTLGAGLVPARKVGKLPWKTRRLEYQLEYGTDAIEVHLDAIHESDRVAIVDDLIATGGTAEAAVKAVQAAGATLVGLSVLIELTELEGRGRLPRDMGYWKVLAYPHPA